ncbi:protein PRR14L isoform X2 [Hemicordylus capensis]|nr:protein PRR14L isoform X2 [Hemicordylus capensis]XP_053135493.1 protein PRR14L isoform X2 [Hemicordylus capensis]XP_053135494.1 protein PRR14L isoform X2 [Hemicordylus capensis]
MSAAVQELYPGPPGALSTDQTALSDQAIILDADPETSAFALPCGSGLPSEHQRTYEGKICYQDSDEKLDCTGKASCPRLMELLPKEPAEAGGLAEDDKAQSSSSMEQNSLHQHLREAAETAKDMKGIAEECLVPVFLSSKETCWPTEKVLWPIQEGGEFLSRPPCVEIAGSLQSLEESQANVQVTTESLPSPMNEAQGMKADGPRLFSKAGESRTRGSPGVSPESSECSAVDTVTAKAEVSETDTLVSLEPVKAMDSALAKAQLPDEEDCEGLTTCSASTTNTDVLSGSEAGGEKILNQETEVNAILDHCLPSQKDEVDLHGTSRSDSGLESRVSVDALLSDTDCDASDCLLQGSLEFGNMLWSEITDIFEVVCEMREDLPAGEEKNLRSGASCEQIQLLEEWASTGNIEGRLSPARLDGEGSSDDEQEVRDCIDHSYSCVSEGTVETEKGDAVQYSWEETQGSFHSVKQELQICPSAKEKSVHSENGTFCLLDLAAHSSSEEYAEVDLRSAPSRIDNIQKDDQLRILSCIGSLATVGEKNTPLLVDVDHFECFQDNCRTNINSIPTHYGTLNCGTRLCEGLLLPVKSNSDPGAEMGASTPRLHATSSSSPADMDLVTDKGSPQTIQPSGACSFSQQADAVLSSSGLLDSPPGEEFPGSCSKEERRSFACLKEFSPANQNGRSCREMSQHSTALMLSDAEKRVAEKTVAESNTCCPSGPCMGGLCCAARTCCSISKQVGVEGHVLETRTGTDTLQVDGLGMRQASSSPKIVGPSQGCEGVEEHSCLPHENGGGDLGGAESTLGSIGSVGVSSTGLSEAEGLESWAEAGSQRTDDHCVKAEETQDVDLTHVYPPYTNPEQKRIKTSLREGPSYMETMESEEMQEESCRNGVSEKLGGDKNVDITLQPLELGRFREVQDKEELERFQAPSSSCSSSPSVLSDLRTGLNSEFSLDLTQQQGYSSHLEYLCSKDPGQLWEALCQRKIQAHAQQNCYLDSQASFNQKNETLEAEGLECQQHPLVISEKQKEECTVGAAETQKCTSCNQKEWLCPARDGDGTPPAPGLLTENSAEETFQQNASNCSSNKTELQPVGSPSKGELKHTTPPSECSEHVSRLLTLSGFSKQQADDMETDASGSASLSVSGSPSDGLEKNNSPKFNYEPASPPSHDCFHSDPLTLTTDNSQKSTEGVCSKSCRSKEISSLIYIPLEVQPAQNPGSGSSQKDEPSASPLLNVLCSPPAKKPCAVIGSFEREADDGACPLASENEKAICSVKGFAPLNKAVPTSMVDSKAGVEIIGQTVSVTSSSMDSATKIRQPVEDDQREISLTAETKNLPVRSLPNTEDSSGFLLQDLKLPLGGEETPVPSKAGIHAQPSFVHSLEGPSELGLRKEQSFVNRPSKQAVVTWISEDMGHGLHSQDLFPVRAPENLCCTVPFASLGGGMPEASPKCSSSKGRSWQNTDNDQELAGDRKKPSEYSVNKGIEVPVKDMQASETEACPTLNKKPIQEEADRSPEHRVVSCNVIGPEQRAKEKVNQRILRIERPLHGTPLKPEIAIRQTVAVGHVIEGSKNKNPCSTLRDSKRPKRSRGLSGLEYMEAKASEARSPSLSFRNCSQPSTDSSTPLVPAFCTFLQAVNLGHNGIRRTAESARKIRLSPLFRRPPGKVCRSSMPGWFKAARKATRMRSATPRKHPSEVVPMHNDKLAGSVAFARQMAAIENKGAAAIWDPMPKQRAGQSSWSSPSRLSERTKDPAVLKGLSVLANKLLPPEGTLQKPKPLVCSTQFLPLTEKCSQLRSIKLLEVFSCINRKLNSSWANGSRCGTQASSSQSLTLYPVESTSLCVLELRHRTPFSFNAPFLPVSFHIKMGPPMPTKNLMGTAALQGVPDKLALGEAHWTWPPSKWTFSFLLPPSCLGIAPIQEGAWLPPESSTAPVPLSAAKGRERSAIAQRSVGFPMLGLQTVLALSSPGCYRFWMRKKNLASRIPNIQRLALLQFTQGLKGLKCSASVSADLFSPLPYSLGRVLSIWSQHGPATCPSEFTLHSNRCKWQPITAAATRLGLGNSSAMWPQVPDQVIGAPRAVNDDIRLEPSFSASLPTSCSIPGPALSALGLLAPELQVHRLDELDVSVPVLPKTGTCLEKAEPEKRPKKVSQIRIRKTIPKPDPNLTPMGLPRPKRLKKTEFSLEEIYTNKNYKSPPTTRCLETIFEEPKERNGSLISVSQQKRKRILEFQDFTVPRKRKARSRVKVMGSSTRAQKAALEGRELDVLLIQKLTDLEAFFAKEEWEQTPGS